MSLPDNLFHRADREAARRGMSRSSLCAEALHRFLEPASDPDPVTARLDEISGEEAASGETRPPGGIVLDCGRFLDP